MKSSRRTAHNAICLFVVLLISACAEEIYRPGIPIGFRVYDSRSSYHAPIYQWVGDLRDKNGNIVVALSLKNGSTDQYWIRVKVKKPTYANWQEESRRLDADESRLFSWNLPENKPRPFPISWAVFSDPSMNNLVMENHFQYSSPLSPPMFSSGQLYELQIFLMFWSGPVIALLLGAGIIIVVMLLAQKGRKS